MAVKWTTGGAGLALVGLVTAALTTVTPAQASPNATAPTAAAAASTPILLSDDNAGHPDVVVESDGTSHVVWFEDGADGYQEIGYCRLPRGATACDHTGRLAAPTSGGGTLSGFGTPQILSPEDGRLVVLATFCCADANSSLMMWESTDDGASFGPPKRIGTGQAESAVYGPGDHAVTVGFGGSSAPAAASVQVAETDASEADYEHAYALVGDPDLDQWYSGGVGLLDSATPITAYTDLADTYLRVFDATQPTSSLNDGAAWLPALKLAGESEPRLVSGAAGVYLLTYYNYSGNILDGAYRVRRVTADDTAPSGLRLSDPVLGSERGNSLFGAIYADAGDAGGNDGGVTTVWTDSGSTAAIKSAYAAGGGQFRAPGTLVAKARAANLDVATAGDGGGAVVWDENFDGKVWVAPIPVGGVPSDEEPAPTHDGGFTPPKNTPKCTTSLTVRPGVVAAVRGGKCWDHVQGPVWTTKGDVNVNGIDFITDKAATSVTVDLGSDKLTATAGVLQKAGSLIFAKDAGTWDLGGTTAFEGVEKANIKLFDFPVMGRASVVFKQDKAEVTANLGLPKPFDSYGKSLPVTVQTVLTTTQKKGLILTGIKATAEQISVGGFTVRKLAITYDAGLSEFSGYADLVVSDAQIHVGVGFKKGKLTKLFFTYMNGQPFPIMLFKGIWLNGVGFSYDSTDGFALGGGGHLSFPVPTTVMDDPPIALDGIGSPPGTGGGFLIKKSTNGVMSISIAAVLKIFGFDIGSAHAYFDTTGVLTFEGNLHIGWSRLGLHGTVSGGVDAPAGTWGGYADVEACLLLCVPAAGAITNVGVGVCAEIDLWLTTIGITVGYVWKQGLVASFGCDMGPFLNPPPPGEAGPTEVSASSDGTVAIPANMTGKPRSYVINVPGAGGVPLVTVRDVYGSVIVASDPAAPNDPQENEPVLLTPSTGTSSVRILVMQQPSMVPTVLKISSSPQSRVALARRAGEVAISVAEVVGTTEVQAQVGGSGVRRSVTYTASHLVDGERTVTFVETDSTGRTQELGTVTAEAGELAFTPLDGPKGKRTISAVVTNSEGVPVTSTDVATYSAPGWVLPGKAGKVKLRHKGGKLAVSWKAPKGAAKPARWQVYVRLPSGQGRLFTTKKPTLTVKKVGKKDKVTVIVTGQDTRGRQGKSVTKKG